MRASNAINPRIKIAKATRRIHSLKRAENTDGANVGLTLASALVSRRGIANLRMNCLEKVGPPRHAVRRSDEYPSGVSPCEVKGRSVRLGGIWQQLCNRGSTKTICGRAISRWFAHSSAVDGDNK